MSKSAARKLLAEIADVVHALPAETVERLAGELGTGPLSAQAVEKASQEVHDAGARKRVKELLREWLALASGITGATIGWALRAASATDAACRKRQTLDLTWTGPTPAGSTFRRIDEALLQLINWARKDLLIVTFAAHKVAEVRDAILEAVRRGVHVTLVLESSEESKGKLTFDAAHALGDEILSRARVCAWPYERRPKDPSGNHGSLHAKCAVADAETLLVSSANLTGFALTLNMELGILIRGGDLPAQVARHFEALACSEVLVTVAKTAPGPS